MYSLRVPKINIFKVIPVHACFSISFPYSHRRDIHIRVRRLLLCKRYEYDYYIKTILNAFSYFNLHNTTRVPATHLHDTTRVRIIVYAIMS